LLEGSLLDACARARDAFKVLVVFVHSELHEDAGELLGEVMKDRRVSDLCKADAFVWWGVSALSTEGQHVCQALQVSEFPFFGALVATSPTANAYRLASRFTGRASAERLVAWLDGVRGSVYPELVVLQTEAVTRERDRLLRDDQERRYREIEEEDRRRLAEEEAKARATREAEAAAARQQQLDAETKELTEAVRMSMTQDLEERAAEAARHLRPEPPEGASSATSVRFSLPGGTVLERRFHDDETQGVVRGYVLAALVRLGFSSFEAVELDTRHPRRSLPRDEDRLSLREVGLTPSARLVVSLARGREAHEVAKSVVVGEDND
jgi:hypothetical protein